MGIARHKILKVVVFLFGGFVLAIALLILTLKLCFVFFPVETREFLFPENILYPEYPTIAKPFEGD